jgi:hypothetical protein
VNINLNKIIEGSICMLNGFENSVVISKLYEITSIYEEHIKETKKGKSKRGTKIVIYRQFENHLYRWFIHLDENLYILSEIFAHEML